MTHFEHRLYPYIDLNKLYFILSEIKKCNLKLGSYLLNSTLHGLPVKPDQPVLSDVEVNEVKSGSHLVVVGELLDQVRTETEPQDRLGDEGVVEPLELVVRDVQPLEVVLAHQQAVDVFQLVVVETEGLEKEVVFVIMFFYCCCCCFCFCFPPGPIDYAEHVIEGSQEVTLVETISITSIKYFGACRGVNSQLWVMSLLS